MTLYEGFIEIPMIEIEDEILWVWLREKLMLNKEYTFGGGFIVKLQDIKEHYGILFNSYIDFEFENDAALYDLRQLLNILLDIVDEYIRTNDICYIIGF